MSTNKPISTPPASFHTYKTDRNIREGKSNKRHRRVLKSAKFPEVMEEAQKYVEEKGGFVNPTQVQAVDWLLKQHKLLTEEK